MVQIPVMVPEPTVTMPEPVFTPEQIAAHQLWKDNNPDEPDVINDPLSIQLDSLSNEDLQDVSHILPDVFATSSTIAESTLNAEDLDTIDMIIEGHGQVESSTRDQPQQEDREGTPGRRRRGARM